MQYIQKIPRGSAKIYWAPFLARKLLLYDLTHVSKWCTRVHYLTDVSTYKYDRVKDKNRTLEKEYAKLYAGGT